MKRVSEHIRNVVELMNINLLVQFGDKWATYLLCLRVWLNVNFQNIKKVKVNYQSDSETNKQTAKYVFIDLNKYN